MTDEHLFFMACRRRSMGRISGRYTFSPDSGPQLGACALWVPTAFGKVCKVCRRLTAAHVELGNLHTLACFIQQLWMDQEQICWYSGCQDKLRYMWNIGISIKQNSLKRKIEFGLKPLQQQVNISFSILQCSFQPSLNMFYPLWIEKRRDTKRAQYIYAVDAPWIYNELFLF